MVSVWFRQRCRKLIDKQNGSAGYWERTALGSFELYRRYNGGTSTSPDEEMESHHLFQGEQKRILLI